MKNHFNNLKLIISFTVISCIISGCSNPKNQQSNNTNETNIFDNNVLEGSFWKNQALTDIPPYWTKYSLDTVDGVFITNPDSAWNQFGDTEKYPSMISRHIFSYSVAYLFTGDDKYLKIASDAVDFLLEYAWDEEYGGWYEKLDKQGNPVELYFAKD